MGSTIDIRIRIDENISSIPTEIVNKLRSKIYDVTGKLHINDNILWVIYDNNNYPERSEYGFYNATKEEIWISSYTLTRNIVDLPTKYLRFFQDKEKVDRLGAVMIDELAHYITKLDHGDKYNETFDMLMNQYYT